MALLALACCARSDSRQVSDGDEGGSPEAAQPPARGDRAAVREAVKKATGQDPGEDVCAEWPPSFPRVVVVGSFAHDRGCTFDGLLVDRTWLTGGEGVSAAGLASAGWAEADMYSREKLAKAWVEEVEQAFGGHFVQASTTAFTFDDTPAFDPVRVRTTKVLGVVVEGWIAEPSGMVWEESYHYVEYRFDREGNLKATSERSFSVAGERIQEHERSQTPDGTPNR